MVTLNASIGHNKPVSVVEATPISGLLAPAIYQGGKFQHVSGYTVQHLVVDITGEAVVGRRSDRAGALEATGFPGTQLQILDAELVKRLAAAVGDDKGKRDTFANVRKAVAVAVRPGAA